MSCTICPHCDRGIDEDYDAEHVENCEEKITTPRVAKKVIWFDLLSKELENINDVGELKIIIYFLLKTIGYRKGK